MNPGCPFSFELLEYQPQSNVLSSPDNKNDVYNVATIIGCIDLTSLEGDDTSSSILDLCQKAKEISRKTNTEVAALCIYPQFIPIVVEQFKNSSTKVCTVSGGFPHGLSSLSSRILDVQECIRLGANEIDIVIPRHLAIENRWYELYLEIKQFKDACVNAKLKVILETGELQNQNQIFKAAMTTMMAGADFIKTSTGKGKTNATAEAGAAMVSAIQHYYQSTHHKVGFKIAGGIRTLEQSNYWYSLLNANLGKDWTQPELFRIGASSLIDNINLKLIPQKSTS